MLHREWIARAATAALSCCALMACNGSDDATPPPPTPAVPTATAPPSAQAPPAPNADIVGVATRLGAAYAARAKFVEAMAKGATLSAADTQSYWQASADAASICDEIDRYTRKNPRSKRQMTEALEKYAKASIIRNTKASSALDKARKAGSGGKPASPAPADLAATINKHGMVEMRVKGMMSYRKDEME